MKKYTFSIEHELDVTVTAASIKEAGELLCKAVAKEDLFKEPYKFKLRAIEILQ